MVVLTVHAPTLQGAVSDPRRVGRWCFSAIAVAGVLGILQRVLPAFPLSHVLDLDFEWVPAAFLSAGLLVAAALSWWQLHDAWPARAFASLLAVMSFDELCGLHEWLEKATGVDWELLYAPVVAVAAVGALTLLLRWGPGRVSGLLVAGGGCWFVAQVLEALEWDGDVERPHYAFYMVPEELLEMSGSALLLLCALWALQSTWTGSGRA